MSRKNVTAKFMNEKLKRGWCLKDFLQEFEATEEEFLEMLDKALSTRAAKGMKQRIAKNEKIAKPSSKPEPEEVLETAPEAMEIAEEESKEGKIVDFPENKVVREKLGKEELEAKKEKIEDLLFKIESSIAKTRGNISSVVDKVTAYQSRLEAMKKQVMELQKNFEKSLQALDEQNSLLLAQKNEKQVWAEELKNVQAQLDALRKITIYAYEDGEIDIETCGCEDEIDVYSIDYDQNLFEQITSDERFENLTIRQAKQIAKLQRLKKMLQDKRINIEVTFENINVEKAFAAV